MEGFVAAILILILAMGTSSSGQIERAMEKHLRSRFPTAEKVNVRVTRGHRSPFSRTVDRVEINLVGFQAKQMPLEGLQVVRAKPLVCGKINNLVIVGERFQMSGLPIERMELSISRIRYDLWRALVGRKLRVVRVGEINACFVLTDRALQQYIAPKALSLDGLQVTFLEGKVRLVGRVRSWLRLPIEITAGLELRGEGRMVLVDPQLRFCSVPAPRLVADRVVKEINALLDITKEMKIPFDVKLTRTKVSPHQLFIWGEIEPKVITPGHKKQAPPPTVKENAPAR